MPRHRSFLNGTDDLIQKILTELTTGLLNVATGTDASFDIGPLADFGGNIEGVLNKFGLDFGSFVDGFKMDFSSFKDNVANYSSVEMTEIFDLKPLSLARFGNLLQIGSKRPSAQFKLPLKQKLWDKLQAQFPSYLYHGIPVPGLPVGLSFGEAYPDRGDFPVRDFLPALAVAFGKATSFSDARALSFTMDDIFAPQFGPELSIRLLDKLKTAPSLAGLFDKFDVIDSTTGEHLVVL